MESAFNNLCNRLDGLLEILSLDPSLPQTEIASASLEERLKGGSIIVPRERLAFSISLRASLIILTVSYFEQFLRELLSAFLTRISGSNSVTWNDLPARLRHRVLARTLAELSQKITYWKNIEEFETDEDNVFLTFQRYLDWRQGEHNKNVAIDIFLTRSDDVLVSRTSRSSTTITKVFERIGIENVFYEVLPQRASSLNLSMTNLAPTLDAIIARRNQVTHEVYNLNRTPQAIHDDIRFVRNLSNLLVLVVQNHHQSLLQSSSPSA